MISCGLQAYGCYNIQLAVFCVPTGNHICIICCEVMRGIVGWLYCIFAACAVCSEQHFSIKLITCGNTDQWSCSASRRENKCQYTRLKHCPSTYAYFVPSYHIRVQITKTRIWHFHLRATWGVSYREDCDAQVFRITVYILINRHWGIVIKSPFLNVLHLLRREAANKL